MTDKKSYFSIKRVRLDDDLFKRWQTLKDKHFRTMNAVLGQMLDHYEKKEKRIVGQNKKIVGQRGEGKKILDIFYEINKTIDYAKPFEWKAADELIKQFGLERVEKVARFSVQVRGMKYAPSITKPSELKEKWAKLETFALAEKNKQSNNLNIGSITPS